VATIGVATGRAKGAIPPKFYF